MTSGNAWRDAQLEKRRHLTPLNLATDAAYARCAGAHTPSGVTVTRTFPGLERVLPTCLSCGVPYGAPAKASWTSR